MGSGFSSSQVYPAINSGHTNLADVSLKRLKSVPDKSKDGLSLIWVGALPESYNQSKFKNKLNLLDNALEFSSLQSLLDKVNVSNAKTIFVVFHAKLDKIAEETIDRLNEMSQVYAVYIILPHEKAPLSEKVPQKYSKINHNNPKVKLFQSLNGEMIDNIRAQMRTAIKMSLDFNMFDQNSQSTTLDLTRNAAAFLWFQVLLNVLRELGFDKFARDEMIEMCEEYYQQQNNENELKNIADFRLNYKKPEAISWYTRESFLYKLLNKALRTENVHSLVRFRAFIVDLCHQIDKLDEERKSSGNKPVPPLYRGQLISLRELDEIKGSEKKLISVKGFFSTTSDKQKAMEFAVNEIQSASLGSILFEITAPSDLTHTKFADISKLSEFPDEKETLFSLGAAFRIDSIELQAGADGFTLIKMTATDEGYNTVNQYIEQSKKDFEDEDKKILFGRLLVNMGQYKESKDYFDRLIESMKNTDRKDTLECAALYHNLGRVSGYMGEFAEALRLMTDALNIRRKQWGEHDVRIAYSFNSIGVIESEMGSYQKAMETFIEALKLYQKEKASSPEKSYEKEIAVTKSNIGWVYYLQGNYEKSRKYHTEALESRQKLMDQNDLLVADSLHSLGALHHAKGEYDEAMIKYREARSMRKKILPGHHPAIANSDYSLASIEFEYGRYQQALRSYEDTLEILRKAFGADHLRVATTYNAIGSVHLEMGDYENARTYYEEALKITIQSLSKHHPAAGECLHHIGTVYERQGSYNDAIKKHEEALECIQKRLPINHPSIARVLISMANVYIIRGSLGKAEIYLQRAYEMQKTIYSVSHPDLVLTLNNMGVLHTMKCDFQKAATYHTDALKMCNQCFPLEHPAVARTKFNMADMYMHQQDYQKALETYLEALSIREVTLRNDLSVGDISSRIACIYFYQGKYLEAKQYWTVSSGIYETHNFTGREPTLRQIQNNIRLTEQKLEEQTTK